MVKARKLNLPMEAGLVEFQKLHKKLGYASTNSHSHLLKSLIVLQSPLKGYLHELVLYVVILFILCTVYSLFQTAFISYAFPDRLPSFIIQFF